jgi:uncharacterized repeat protein (TIGR04076 family)
MYELRVTVTEILGHCPAHPFIKVGDSFVVHNGDLYLPGDNQRLCLWALSSIMSLLPPKECSLVEKPDGRWIQRTRFPQCPDPEGRVIFRVESREKVAHPVWRQGSG